MTPTELDLIIRILGLLIGASEAAIQRVPAAFRPAGIKKNLDEATELLNRLKAGR